MSIATLGGFLLIIGAFFTYKGKIFTSVIVYFLADICWVIISIKSGDYFGSIVVIIGMLLGFGAFLKMHKGEMRKTLEI